MDLLPQLLEETAARGLKRIWTELRYKDYVEQQQLDGNKFEILTLLAEREADLNTLVARLDYLRMLVSAPPEPSSEGLILSTVHSSKGLEYETVYLSGRAGWNSAGRYGAEGLGGGTAVSGGAQALLCGDDPGKGPSVPVLLPRPQLCVYQRIAPGAAGGKNRGG